MREAIPDLERRVWGTRRALRTILSWGAGDAASCAWHARIALARMDHARARAEILDDLGSWRRETREAAVVAAGRARMRRGARRAREPRRICRWGAGSRGARASRGRLIRMADSAMKVAGGLRYQGALARRGHVEGWFLKANDPLSRRAIWLKWTVWASEKDPRAAVAEVWAVAFGSRAGHVAAKSGAPFVGSSFDSDGVGVTVDGCTLTSKRRAGASRLATGPSRMSCRSRHWASRSSTTRRASCTRDLARSKACVPNSKRTDLRARRRGRRGVGSRGLARDGRPQLGSPAHGALRLGSMQRVGQR